MSATPGPSTLITAIDPAERRRREQVQEATYRISRAVLAGDDLNALFAELHRIIGGLMPARNCYVALLSADRSLLSFPYFVDEGIPAPPARKPGHGLTEYVLDTGQPLLTTADELTVPLREHGRHAEGTGLGLNVSRGIVEQMGGRLLLDSRAGWGSRFWFEVPLPAAAAGAVVAPAAAPHRIAGYTGPRRSVLVADDHPANSRLLVDLLAPLGFHVTVAADGIEAVARARELRPDLVLMDLRMPRLDGFGAARAIRDAFPEGPPRIIGVSASAFEPDRDACLQAGCVEFLAKPFH